MEAREGNVVFSLLITVITTKLNRNTIVSVVSTDVAPLTPIIIFVEEEGNVRKGLDIVEDSDRAVQKVVTMCSIGEGNKEHLLLEVLPTLALADPYMINLLGCKKNVDLISIAISTPCFAIEFKSTMVLLTFDCIMQKERRIERIEISKIVKKSLNAWTLGGGGGGGGGVQ
jgi:hypothetical protein